MDSNFFENTLKNTIKDFKEINNFNLIGIIGSLDIKKEIDLMIIPKKKIKQGNFLKTLCNFLELLDKNLKRENLRLIVFTYSIFEEEVDYISKRTENDLFIHLNNTYDLSLNNEEIIKSMIDNVKIFYGKKELPVFKRTNLDYYYRYLFFTNCLYSKYPRNLETNKIKKRISYIFKNNNSKINLKNKSNKDIYFECCNFLDSKL